MSLWTPSGEHPVGSERTTPGGSGPLRTGPGGGGSGPGAGGSGPGAGGSGPGAGGSGPGASGSGPGPGFSGAGDGSDADDQDVDALRRQLAEAPADVVVANHCYGLFELAALYLSHSPPRLEQARLPIDALGLLIDGLGDRLGEAHASLRDALAQLRLAYVQIGAAAENAHAGDGAAEHRSEGAEGAAG